MENFKSKQLYIISFEYPLDSISKFVFNSQINELICKKENFYIKKFIGSDWSIIDSGFIFSGPNNFNITYTLSFIERNDFCAINKFSINHINNIKNNNYIALVFSLISNTMDYSSIMEFRLEFENNVDLKFIEDFIEKSLIKEIISSYSNRLKSLLKSFNNKDNNESLLINHSFIIRKYYKDAFNFFYNWNNIAKSLKTDKVWKIINENEEKDDKNFQNFTVIINENTKIHYRIVSIKEEKGEKIEIVYNKTSNSFPALNNYIKLIFFNIDKDVCFFLYETNFPINISSSLLHTASNYLYYCNRKSKIYFETNKI
jgi:hypothetical protein